MKPGDIAKVTNQTSAIKLKQCGPGFMFLLKKILTI